MQRRDALKAIVASSLAVSAINAYDEKLIKNTKDMAVKDPANPSKFEAKHLPCIKVSNDVDENGYTLVQITVGQEGIIHPSVANHWIYELDLWADDKLIAKLDLEPVISRGYLGARVKLEGIKELKSTAKCNLHGNYTAILKL